MLKQTLLAFTVLGFAGSAAAATDITNPFFLPEAMHVASVTSASFTKMTEKVPGLSIREYTKSVTEDLQFGILNNLAVIGGVEKNWFKGKLSDPDFSITAKDKNDLDWTAGLAWNILDCNTKLQLSSVYGQNAPGSQPWYHQGTYKFIDTELKFGYQLKSFLPYMTFNVHTPVAQTDMERKNRWNYGGKVGLYQGKCGVWSLDTALDLQFDRQTHSRFLTAEAEASVYVAKNVALGVYGSYLLDAKTKYDPDVYGKSVGARMRLYF